MKRQSGFTLIELIIVIVILGILAVTAAPQFFNFGSDARAATVRGLEGSIKTASELVHARVQMDQVEGPDEVGRYYLVRESGDRITLTRALYAEASEEGIWSALNLSDGDWIPMANAEANPTSIVIYPAGFRGETGCSVTYTYPSENNTVPMIESSVESC